MAAKFRNLGKTVHELWKWSIRTILGGTVAYVETFQGTFSYIV